MRARRRRHHSPSTPQHRLSLLARLRLVPRFFGEDVSRVLTQSYGGDVTILPRQRLWSQWRALSQPSEAEMAELIRAGELATYPHVAHVRAITAVEKKLSELSHRFAAARAASAQPIELTGLCVVGRERAHRACTSARHTCTSVRAPRPLRTPAAP